MGPVMKNTLKETMKKRPVFGATVLSGSPMMVEALGHFGYDFVFIDAEHTPLEVTQLKELILAARFTGISPLVRVTRPEPVEIRKAFEMGAEGVVVPHIKTKAEMELCIQGAKFPPKGRRGYDPSVRSAGYGAGDYDAAAYIEHSNETELVIPLAEDFEFIENIDEILSVEGLEIVNFGPVDFALSKNKVFCGMDMPEIVDALTTIIEKCRAKNISVMVPGIPPTYESVKSIIDMGANMLAVGTDIMHFNNGLRTVKENVVSTFQS